MSTKSVQKLYKTLRDRRTFTGRYMPEDPFRRLIKVADELYFSKDTVIFEQNRRNDNIYILTGGKISIERNGKLIVTMQRVGDIFGEISFIYNTNTTASVIALIDVSVLMLKKQDLDKVGSLEFHQWLCRVLAEKIIRTTRLIGAT